MRTQLLRGTRSAATSLGAGPPLVLDCLPLPDRPRDVARRLALLVDASWAEKPALPIRACSVDFKVDHAKRATLWMTILICCALG